MQQRILRILWPSFLMAGALEAMVFVVVDPHEMRWYGGPLIGWTPLAIYSVTFLIFWCVIATTGAITLLLTLTAEEVNAFAHDGSMRTGASQGP